MTEIRPIVSTTPRNDERNRHRYRRLGALARREGLPRACDLKDDIAGAMAVIWWLEGYDAAGADCGKAVKATTRSDTILEC